MYFKALRKNVYKKKFGRNAMIKKNILFRKSFKHSRSIGKIKHNNPMQKTKYTRVATNPMSLKICACITANTKKSVKNTKLTPPRVLN